MTAPLGRLVAISVRDVWGHEANEFTPWLALPDNIATLGDALGLGEIEVEATEHCLGRFSADIVARAEDDSYVLIENQLEPTDHRHLGQLLTYLAGLDGEATVVWVATAFLEEHRAAIDWLNANTNDRFNFFGVEIEVLKIGESPPAPRFNVVAKPNNWSRAVGVAARRASETPINATAQFYQSYWLALRDSFLASGDKERFPKAWPRQWLPFKIGRSGFKFDIVLLRAEKRIRFELYLQQRGVPFKQAFHQLFEQRSDIERELGTALEWQELPERTASRVALHLDADPQDQADWPRQHRWLFEQRRAFRKVFTPRIKDLKLDIIDDEGDDVVGDEEV